VTLELGPEQLFERMIKLANEMKAERFTSLDVGILKDAQENVLVISAMADGDRGRQALRVGRLRHRNGAGNGKRFGQEVVVGSPADVWRHHDLSGAGFITYCSHFYATQLRPTLRRIDACVIRWARRKFKRMVHQTNGVSDQRDRFRRANPYLFAHSPLCDGNGRTSRAV
jgi:hypothetical protein